MQPRPGPVPVIIGVRRSNVVPLEKKEKNIWMLKIMSLIAFYKPMQFSREKKEAETHLVLGSCIGVMDDLDREFVQILQGRRSNKHVSDSA
jgi:hypothetical protein